MKRKITLSELSIVIEELKSEISNISNDLRRASTIEKTIELTGLTTLLSEVVDFEKLKKNYYQKIDKLIELQNLRIESNSRIKISNCDTIATGLNKKNALKNKLLTLESIYSNKPCKFRRDSPNVQSYFKATELNFKPDLLKEEIDLLKNDIKTLEVSIQLANSNTELEIDL